MPSPSTQSAAVPVSLPLDIQTIIIRDYLIAEYRIHRARTYRVPASYDIRKKSPDRHTFGRYALVSSYWRALVQSVLFQKFQFEGLHNLRDLQALCKQNPTLATYTRELRVVSGDWEAPPKSVLTCMSPSNVSYRRVAPEPTVLEQFSQAMWAMLQHWNSVRGAREKGYGRILLSLEIEFYVSNPATGLPKCFAPLMTGYADQKLEFLDSLEIKAHNVSKPTLRRMLPPVFYPAPLLPIVLAARELRTLALRTEVLSEDSTTGTPDSDSDDGAIIPRAVPGVTSMTSSNLTQLFSRMAAYRSLKSAQFELFVKKPLRTGAPDLLSRAVRDISYALTEFRAYISHISTEISAPDTYDDDDLQDQWQEMKSYSLAFGDQDAWGDAYFFSVGHHQNTRSPRLERLEPFMRASVEQLTRMPKIEKWEVGCIDLCMTVIVTRDRYSESALCHHTKNYIPSNRVKEILRERWPQVSFETSLGPRMMDWRGLGSYVPITWDSELYPHRFG
ncbi:hypothetical protein BGX38DRAFT_1200560 [Terfezia claveryi]|nr:hypothetical protein BGX38DRAFT_1200560 [Terfezia claveryi]